jgi:hypothetical protein
VQPSKIPARSSLFVAAVLALALVGTPRVGHAQTRGDCSTSAPAAIGVSIGRSSPYFDLSREIADPGNTSSLLVRSGNLLSARVDLPISGPWRARIEGSGTNWRVERRTYGSNGQVTSSDTAGHVEARQIVGMVGRQGGRNPVCGYVLAGGGLYSLEYQGTSLRRPGVALTAGVEIPTGARGAVQADVQLHVINTRGRYPIASSQVLAASISVGWSYRF